MNDTANRILMWFNRQEQYVQTAIIADVDAGMESQYASALRRLADELEGKGYGGDTGPAKTGGRPEEPPMPPKRPR